MSLLTLGFVIARIGVWLRALAASNGTTEPDPTGTAWVGAAFVAVGLLANGMATYRYLRARRAIVRGEPIPDGTAPAALAIAVTVLGAVMSAYLLVRLR